LDKLFASDGFRRFELNVWLNGLTIDNEGNSSDVLLFGGMLDAAASVV
jgi:hypothetical protein